MIEKEKEIDFMDITQFDRKIIEVTDKSGNKFIGIGKYLPSGDNDDEGELLLVKDRQTMQINEIEPDNILKIKELTL